MKKLFTLLTLLVVLGTSAWADVPYLIGVWKVGDNVVTGLTTNVKKGDAATVPNFVVGASAGTPTTDDYTVAYSLKAGSTAGIFTYTAADGVSAINTSVDGTATIVATLTTKDDKKFQTPATNTFEYTVNTAEKAPVFTVTGSESAVRGDALQLTANVTAGNPTPTIQWFSSDDGASITNPEAQGEAGTDKLKFDVPTTYVGIYYYYAVANNGIGGDGAHDVFSNIKTITVKPKSPTITSSADFGTSIKVFIKKADGEDDEAVIKYKIGNGEWQDYPDGDTGIELSATTTVYAKVVQEDIESAVVSATYYTTASFAAGKEYITFASPYALDCTTANLPAGLKAYKATGASASSVTIEEVNSTVTAGTGLLLQRTGDTSAAGNFTIPVVATGTDISGTNKFVGVTAAAGAAIGGDGVYDYVLKDGQFHHASSGTLAQGKAYLHLDAAPSAPVLSIDFGDVTGINEVQGSGFKANGYYDLQGRKVAQPSKGLYIVNGKKVVIK